MEVGSDALYAHPSRELQVLRRRRPPPRPRRHGHPRAQRQREVVAAGGCFFALYGSKALDETLEDVVSIGAEDAEVELWFTHAGGDYHVERRVRVRDERAVTAKAVPRETPEGTYEGARAVRQRVTDLLRMDHEAFVNCAYVRQGEVNKLINASPASARTCSTTSSSWGNSRRYRERASDARVGVKRVRDGKRDVLENLDQQIEAKEDKDLHERLNDLGAGSTRSPRKESVSRPSANRPSRPGTTPSRCSKSTRRNARN